MFKKISLKLLVVMLLVLTTILSAQTVHQVAAGTDVLKPAIDGAAAGDIVELTTSGGEYLSNSLIYLNNDVTIRGAEGLAEKPVIKYIGAASSAYIFRVPGSQDVTLQNLEVDGDGTDSGADYVAKYLLRLDNGDSTATMKIRIMDCDVHDFTDKFVRPYLGSGIDSMIFQNTTFYNGGKEGVLLYSGSSSDPAINIGYAGFENCTFYNFGSAAIKGDTNPETVVRVNHCTFYDIGTSGNPILFFDDILDVDIKNSIFEGNIYSGYCARFESSASTFHHSSIWDVANWTVATATVSDTHRVDPLFNDPDNGDFTLAADSPVLALADDGEALGDLRWVTGGQYTLTLLTDGTGTITADPEGPTYDAGTVVTLTAVPESGWEFANWSGDLSGTTNPQTITMNADAEVTAVFTYISAIENPELPASYSLQQNYPNPFNPQTTIKFNLEKSGFTTLKIYNLSGEEVATLVNNDLAAGQFSITVNFAELPSGVYFYKLHSGAFQAIKKMMLVK